MDHLADVFLYAPPVAGLLYAGTQVRYVLKTELRKPESSQEREDEELKMFTMGNNSGTRDFSFAYG